jgi:tRNA pseudouridine55 synthase
LAIDKPAGLTSHDVVNRVRRATGERRVGHAGTLDPMATGLLVVLVGPATRLAPFLTAAEKSYTARITFGSETATDDAEGETICTAPVPVMDESQAAAVVSALVGRHVQTPPAFSAIKRDGVVAYRAARTGEPLALETRSVEVFSAELISVDVSGAGWDIELKVSKGTYIRAIARDLGRSLGSAAHLSALRRTGSGPIDLADAVSLADVEAMRDPEEVARHFVDPIAALGLPVAHVTDEGALRVRNGSPLDATADLAGTIPAAGPVAVAHGALLLAVYGAAGTVLKAQVVIPGGVRAGAA